MHPAQPESSDPASLLQAGVQYTHSAVMADDPVADALALPASRGVVVMLGEHDRPVFIAATGDCRALTRRKLAPAERGVRAGTDLRTIVRNVHAVACGSAFEADLVYLLLARQLMPHAAKLVADRWRSWWAQIDPESEFPEWSKTDLGVGAVAPRSAATPKGMVRDAAGCIVGPFADKDAAGRFIERMIDAFDLCREHRLLVLAPAAQACAYKEMGRCAAPCDGSETMQSYRQRVRLAVDAATSMGMGTCVEQEQAAMNAAAAAQDFEAAARHKAQAERLGKLAGPTAARIGQLDDFRFMMVWRSTKPGWVRIAVCQRGFLRWLADLDPAGNKARPGSDAEELCRGGLCWAERQAGEAMGREQVDVLGLLARERVLLDNKRSAWFVPLQRGEGPEVSARALMRAAAAAIRPRKDAKPDGQDGPVHELEAMPEQLSQEWSGT